MGYIKDNWGLGLAGLFFLIIFIWIYNESFVDLNEATRHTGKVERIFTTRDNNKGSSTAPLKKLAIKIEGVNQLLCYYKLTDDYEGLLEKIKTGDVITVYYKPTNQDYNLDLYQIEAGGEKILDKSDFESKERIAAFWALIIGVGGMSYFIYKRVRVRMDYEKTLSRRLKKVRS